MPSPPHMHILHSVPCCWVPLGQQQPLWASLLHLIYTIKAVAEVTWERKKKERKKEGMSGNLITALLSEKAPMPKGSITRTPLCPCSHTRNWLIPPESRENCLPLHLMLNNLILSGILVTQVNTFCDYLLDKDHFFYIPYSSQRLSWCLHTADTPQLCKLINLFLIVWGNLEKK